VKTYIMIASLVVVAGYGLGAAADSIAKANTRIDFNRMIDDNNNTRKELKKDIDIKARQANLDESDARERAKVIDFVDVEVGWGESAPVVDRRFDSIGEARPYVIDESSLATQESGT